MQHTKAQYKILSLFLVVMLTFGMMPMMTYAATAYTLSPANTVEMSELDFVVSLNAGGNSGIHDTGTGWPDGVYTIDSGTDINLTIEVFPKGSNADNYISNKPTNLSLTAGTYTVTLSSIKANYSVVETFITHGGENERNLTEMILDTGRGYLTVISFEMPEVDVDDLTLAVSFVPTGTPDPQTPVITIGTQPAASTTVTEGGISGSLTVAASVTESATLSYQWKQNSANNTSGGTNVGTDATLAIPTDLASGVYYFYCVVSADGGAVDKISNVAKVIVNPKAEDVTQTPAPSVTSDNPINLDMDGVTKAYIGISLGTSVASPTNAEIKADKATVTVEGSAVTVDPQTLTADGNITVTAASKGTATIKIAFEFSNLDSANPAFDETITVNVAGSGPDTPPPYTPPSRPSNNDSDDSDSDSSGGGGGGGSSTSTASSGPSIVSTAAATASVNSALAAARASGADTARARLTNPSDITLATLQAMARQAGTTPLKINADSMNGAAVDVRIVLDPAQATTGLDLSASTINAAARNTASLFGQYFSNDVMTVALGQEGSFGMPVEIAAKLDPTLDTTNLVFYAYDRAANTYRQIAAPAYWVDVNGYIHFTTTLAGNIVISDGALARK